MSEPIAIALADPAEAAAIARLLRRSIRQLCVEDHGNAAGPLDEWLANKRAAVVRGWIANPQNIILVARSTGRLAAIGAITRNGVVSLNYVDPDDRFKGISKAIMAALEGQANQLGLKQIRLESTATARTFYRSIGYRSMDRAETKHGLPSFPMAKLL
jgi:GNAT superfamily N-acetyltransferase